MGLSHEQIITLQNLHGCGVATITKIGAVSNESVSSFNLREFYGHIEELVSQKKITRYKMPSFSSFEEANIRAQVIIAETDKMGISIVSKYDSDYPENLRDTVDEQGRPSAPILLYYRGDLSVTKKVGIAIIGTREPTKEGVIAGKFFGEKLAEAGFNIVSGLAIGCDTAGHRGALRVIEGKTTAFLAHGLDSVYPPENVGLAEEIVERGGLLMSEYAIGESVNRYYLVERDRLQAALSAATIVIQTGVHGGTNHAANTTLISGKPLFCVKYGSEELMHNDKMEGNLALVSKGARFLTSQDYMAQIKSLIGNPNAVAKSLEPMTEVPKQLSLF